MNWIKKLFNPSIPSEKFNLPEYCPEIKFTEEHLELLKEFSVEPKEQSVNELIEKSKHFSVKLPTECNTCEYLKNVKNISEDILNRNINSVYPLIHESVLKLCCEFILYKRSHGSSREKHFYKQIGVKDLINRLINKRAVSFLGSYDKFMLLDGTTGSNQWDSIGKDNETPPLTIDQYLTYDELKLSALLSVSSYTHFVNEGHRHNAAKYEENRSLVESEGIIIGMVGPRLHRSNAVEYQEIVISECQNTKENGFGLKVKNSIPKLFAEFYGEHSLDYDEVLKSMKKDNTGRYTSIFAKYIFDDMLYYKRLTISVDILLGEANARAQSSSQLAYVHIVGIGLGVWKISPHQDKLFMDTFANRIKLLGDKLSYISDIYFAYINATKCGEFEDGDLFPIANHPKGGIRIHIGKTNPHKKLEGTDKGKLLVVSYAWDGNALPGNEYWFGSLTTSGDPAAACSTQVAEIHNPHINSLVCADHLRIVTEGNVLTFNEYKSKLFSINA